MKYSKYEVDDYVKIVTNHKIGKCSDACRFFSQEMGKYKDRTARIKNFDYISIKLDIDGGQYNWSDCMIEPVGTLTAETNHLSSVSIGSYDLRCDWKDYTYATVSKSVKKELKVGDRVRALSAVGADRRGFVTGTVRKIDSDTGYYGVEFDFYIGGHQLGLHAGKYLTDVGRGWWCLEKNLEALKPKGFKIGDVVIGNKTATDRYLITQEGFIGKVILLTDNNIRIRSSNGKEYEVDDYFFDLFEPDKKIINSPKKGGIKQIMRSLLTKLMDKDLALLQEYVFEDGELDMTHHLVAEALLTWDAKAAPLFKDQLVKVVKEYDKERKRKGK